MCAIRDAVQLGIESIFLEEKIWTLPQACPHSAGCRQHCKGLYFHQVIASSSEVLYSPRGSVWHPGTFFQPRQLTLSPAPLPGHSRCHLFVIESRTSMNLIELINKWNKFISRKYPLLSKFEPASSTHISSSQVGRIITKPTFQFCQVRRPHRAISVVFSWRTKKEQSLHA